jgi:pimeloyl-ACP methyl ester carboxylesterase
MLIGMITAAIVFLLLSGIVYEALSRRLDGRRFPPLGQLVDVGGHRLHLFSKGAGEPTVVIEQGAGGPALAWLGIQDQVAKSARVCLYDRAGYQWSDVVSGPRSLEDRVEDLRRLLSNAGLPGPYVMVAHSYGGFLVRLFANRYPSQVAGMVLVDTPDELSYFRKEVLSTYAKFGWVLKAMGLLSWFGLPRLFSRLTSKPDQLNTGMIRREYFAAARDDIGSMEREKDWLTMPNSLGTLGGLPLIVITHGQPFPGPFSVLEKGWIDGQKRLANLSTNGTLIVAEKSNHMIQNDQPEVVVSAILNVLERCSARAAGWLDLR